MAVAGPNGKVNASYQRYAAAAGFHVDACLVRHPEGKGKVESRVGHLAGRVLGARPGGFESLEELQAHTDAKVAEAALRRRCPATGTPVAQAWEAERERLRSPEHLPEVFDVVLTRRVQKDCTVHFEGRVYSVPFYLAWGDVEVRGGPGVVSFWHEGVQVAEHPRGTEERILIRDEHFEGAATPTHLPPLPLGKLGRRIRALAESPVQLRAVDYYEQLLEVGS
jgi:Mu transposase, C-terminal domain